MLVKLREFQEKANGNIKKAKFHDNVIHEALLDIPKYHLNCKVSFVVYVKINEKNNRKKSIENELENDNNHPNYGESDYDSEGPHSGKRSTGFRLTIVSWFCIDNHSLPLLAMSCY